MPLYDFKCKKCTKEYEARQTLAECEAKAPAPECPECGSKDTERIISAMKVTPSSWSMWRR